MLGTIINTVAIVLGSFLGVLAGKRIPFKISDTIIKGFGLVTLILGVKGGMESKDIYTLIFSMVLGIIIGEGFDLNRKIEKLGEKLNRRFHGGTFSKAYVTSTLLFCTGAMAIVGALKAGLNGDFKMLYTKSILDFLSAVVLASSLGIGVVFSALSVFIYQGIITVMSSISSPFLLPHVVTEMSAIGSIMLIALGLNMVEATKLKLMNFVPAIFMPVIVSPIVGFIMNLMTK